MWTIWLRIHRTLVGAMRSERNKRPMLLANDTLESHKKIRKNRRRRQWKSSRRGQNHASSTCGKAQCGNVSTGFSSRVLHNIVATSFKFDLDFDRLIMTRHVPLACFILIRSPSVHSGVWRSRLWPRAAARSLIASEQRETGKSLLRLPVNVSQCCERCKTERLISSRSRKQVLSFTIFKAS